MCSLTACKSASKGVWLFDLTAQLIHATAMLHSQGIVHGDLHPGNILFALPPWLHSISIKDLYTKCGESTKCAVSRLDGEASLPLHVPPYVVPPIWLGKACEHITIADSNVVVTDFGEAWCPAVLHRYTLNTPFLYRPPESVFAETEEQPISFASDVWALGCTIYELFAQGSLFEGFTPGEDDVFAENASALGKPPKPWWDVWRARGEFFDAGGEDWDVKRSKISDGKFLPLATRIGPMRDVRQGKISDGELGDLLDMLGGMIQWRPEDRISAQELIFRTWMRRWGS